MSERWSLSTLAAWHTRFEKRLWEADLRDLPPVRRVMVRVTRLLTSMVRDLQDGQLSLQAMSLVYTTFLSLAPLLAICFSVLKGFGVHNQIEPLLLNLFEPLGERREEIVMRIISFVDNIQVGILGSVGFALLVYSVISLMHKIERAFNYIWHVAEDRALAQRLGEYLAVLFVGPLLMFLSVGITASVRNAPLIERLTGLELVGSTFTQAGKLVPYLLLTLAFTFIYMFMPNTRVRFWAALGGGAVAAVLWKLLGFLFAAFIAGSGNYAAVYSAFAVIILFMIWVYVGWMVVMIGASISYYLQNPDSQGMSRIEGALSIRAREKLALAICALVGENFYASKPAWTREKLARQLRLPPHALQPVLNSLADTGVLAETGDRPPRLLPGRPFDRFSVYDLLASMRGQGEEDLNRLKDKKIDQVEQKIDSSLQSALSATMLKDLSAGK